MIETAAYKFFGKITHEVVTSPHHKGFYRLLVKDDGHTKIVSDSYNTVESAEQAADWIKSGALLDREEGVHWRMFVLTNVDGVDRDFRPFRQEKIRAYTIDKERIPTEPSG